MKSNTLVGKDHLETSVRWGVTRGPALWPVVLRILFVIDGRISTSKDSSVFGLGYVLETLRDDGFAWWVRFQVQVVRRDQAALMQPSQEYPDTNYTAGNEPNFQTLGFRFTEANFSLDNWDQVWFFGDYPGNQLGVVDINDTQFCPLDPVELRLLAEWMDRGGGVFAVGDHWNLGASMCSGIPRARTMRRWTQDQGVPPMDGDARHQTLQLQGSNYLDPLENDAIPQPIEVVYRSWTTSILGRPLLPHPLLSTTTGIIDTFPDHMHEGEVINDSEVELNSPLNIPGYELPEYPSEQPQTIPGVAARIAAGTLLPQARPIPHVVAYGRTTNAATVVSTARVAGDVSSPLFPDKRTTFGLVGAYDGDSVGIGRVVVDSTFHHWFTYNLHGFETANLPVYERMQAYYRNVAIWLATPAQRRSMLLAATWGIVVSDPMAFPADLTRSLWTIGKKAVEVMSRTFSQSMLLDLVASVFSGRAEEIFGVPYDVLEADPYTASAPSDLAVRAIIGGIASSLIRPAFDYLKAEGKQRRLLNRDAIARHAAEGFKQGHRALIDTIQSSAAASKDIVSRLEKAFQQSPQGLIPVQLIGLRVVAERLQIPDPTDPALVDVRRVKGRRGPTRLTITGRVALAGSLLACAVIEGIEIPSFQSGGAFVDLDRVLYEGVVQSGESLVVEVVTGTAGPGPVTAERLRFTEMVEGDPLSWVGHHTPSRSQPWRLWYRIEKTDDTH